MPRRRHGAWYSFEQFTTYWTLIEWNMLKPCAHLRTAFTLSRLIDQTLTFLSIYGHSCSSIGHMVDCCISAPCYTTSLNSYTLALGLPWGSDSKESACSAGDPGSPWVGKISCQRKWQPNPVFLPGESHGRGSLAGHSPWGHKEGDMTERLTLTRSHPCPHLQHSSKS